jgi:hypothetical protein
MGENKTFNVKDLNFVQAFARHPTIVVLISISRFVYVAAQALLYDLKPEAVWQNSPFSAEIYKNVSMYIIFLGATL